MDTTVAIGLIGAICTTIAFLPQVIKAMKTKSTKDISLIMYIIFTIGLFFWLTYGLLINSLPILFANLITIVLSFAVIFSKIRYG